MPPPPVRLDLFLKYVGLLKRRSLAQEACREGAVLVDGVPGRPGRTLRPGQRIEIRWPHRLLEVEVLALPDHPVAREKRADYYRILRDEVLKDDFWED